ncbi:NifU family protein [Natrinema longum]|uniref:NifU family protein n=1 Tax=Natrinema longum TaxID=370324 RepID=A0A8A2U9D0_9EURY|nr:NifU family protein [Natrinema longum]MBZ6496705.1 NifU family protein [Natrinema longum]QSW85401.1 NifU family protein [Natrinema longum]
MSESEPEQSSEDAVREAVSLFLRRNFPQIELHGGDSSITDVDLDERRVSINLSGACSGCGVSPMTTQAIQQRLPAEIDGIDHVSVSTGLDGLAEQGSSGPDVPPDTPF